MHELFARHNESTKIMLMGDVHGHASWVTQKINQAHAVGINLIIQLGDFGVWPGPKGKKYLLEVSRRCKQLEVEVIVVVGNHDDHDRLSILWRNPKRRDDQGEPLPLEIVPHVWIMPRPHRFSLAGVSFLTLGGAASVDFVTRTRGKDWWPGELPSLNEVEKTVQGGYADIILAHETPNEYYAVPPVQEILRNNPMRYSAEGIAYCDVSRSRLTTVLEKIKPKLYVHGHMHVFGERTLTLPNSSHETHLIALDEQDTVGNIYILDLESLKTTLKNNI